MTATQIPRIAPGESFESARTHGKRHVAREVDESVPILTRNRAIPGKPERLST
jgi:hypothetical protein